MKKLYTGEKVEQWIRNYMSGTLFTKANIDLMIDKFHKSCESTSTNSDISLDKSSFVDRLKEYFENTPREKVLEDWAKTEQFDKVGPPIASFPFMWKINCITRARPFIELLNCPVTMSDTSDEDSNAILFRFTVDETTSGWIEVIDGPSEEFKGEPAMCCSFKSNGKDVINYVGPDEFVLNELKDALNKINQK